MPNEGIVIKAGSRLVLEVVYLKGRGKISLDGNVLFREMDIEGKFDAIAQILDEGEHCLDFTVSAAGGSAYDFRTSVKVVKDGHPESLVTSIRLKSSGYPDDTTAGETMRFSAVRR